MLPILLFNPIPHSVSLPYLVSDSHIRTSGYSLFGYSRRIFYVDHGRYKSDIVLPGKNTPPIT